MRPVPVVFIAALILTPVLVHAGPSPQDRCVSEKLSAQARFVRCLYKADGRFVRTGDAATRDEQRAACSRQLERGYEIAERGAACPTPDGWQEAEGYLLECEATAAAATSGGTFPTCGDGVVNVVGEQCDGSDVGSLSCTSLGFLSGTLACNADCTLDTSACGSASDCGNGTIDGSEVCDGAALGGATCAGEGFAGGTLRCGSGCVLDTSGCWATRWVEHGDGTATDNATGLQWELKTDDGSVHDKDNTYAWCLGTNPACTNPANPPDGTAFTSFLAELNGGATGVGNCTSADGISTTGGFAGHCDWRLPTNGELRGIVDLSACGVGAACTTIPGLTVASYYWSSSTFADNPNVAAAMSFGNGFTIADAKSNLYGVRAVRGGS